jgi:hypothetical protein
LAALHKVWRQADYDKITLDELDRMEKALDSKLLLKLHMWFDKLSWEDQITLCIISRHPKLINRLDESQLTTYWIVKD